MMVGSDPEVFLVKNGNFVSSIGKFGGTKAKPKPMLGLPNGFFVQEDNVAVEFNIPPAKTAKQFAKFNLTALNWIKEAASRLEAEVAIVPSAVFPDSELTNPKAREFGCDRDFNVWTMMLNPRPDANTNLRTCGGHVHVAFRQDPVKLGQALDLFLGCPSIMFDADQRRRLLYGQAGTIRIKPYGVEYRVLSNFWLKRAQTCEMIYEQVKQAVSFVKSKCRIDAEDYEVIQNCINNSDMTNLKYLTTKYGLVY